VGEIAEWDDAKLAGVLAELDVGEATEGLGFSEDELRDLLGEIGDDMPNFAPGTEEDQGKLDELEPKIVTCPHCGESWDEREHGKG